MDGIAFNHRENDQIIISHKRIEDRGGINTASSLLQLNHVNHFKIHQRLSSLPGLINIMNESTGEYTPVPIAHSRCQDAFTDLISALGDQEELEQVMVQFDKYKWWAENVGASTRPFASAEETEVRWRLSAVLPIALPMLGLFRSRDLPLP